MGATKSKTQKTSHDGDDRPCAIYSIFDAMRNSVMIHKIRGHVSLPL